MIDYQSVLASHRFGLGARPGDLAVGSRSIRRRLLDEVAGSAGGEAFAALPGTRELYANQWRERTQAQATDTPAKAAPGPAAAAYAVTLKELEARVRCGMAQPFGFAERLALFWANHFTTAGRNPNVLVIAGAFEREAIRPHVAGRFEDMLQAAECHPAMLTYLDNAVSIGPQSPFGRKRKRGLNENLAREILELHTLGVDGGYTQADVRDLAKILTGWTVVQSPSNGAIGTFRFRPEKHEPGAHTVLGTRYAGKGEAQGRAVLGDLARHPSTARHIARRLCRHFIADVPPKEAEDAVAKAFIRSNGELMVVYEALLACQEAWQLPLTKLRSPYEYVLAAARALGTVPQPIQLMRSLTVLGQRPFDATSPKGWPDTVGEWAGPYAIKARLDYAHLAVRHVARTLHPVEAAREVLGPLLSEHTRDTVETAETRQQAFALLLMSPEFQRR